MKQVVHYFEEDHLSVAIYDLLYRLGATANYLGFFYVVHAIRLSVEDPSRLMFVTKWLYPDVAKHYGTNWRAVERDIRTVINTVWRCQPELLTEIAGFQITEKPGPSRFLSILTGYIRQGRAA